MARPRVHPNMRDVEARLSQQLTQQRNDKKKVAAYAAGEAPLKGLNRKILEEMREASNGDASNMLQYQELVSMSSLNMCELIVDSVANDLEVMSFKEVPSSDDSTPEEVLTTTANSEAQARIRRYRLGSIFKQITSDMLHHGDGYGLVDSDTGQIVWLPTTQVVVETDPLDPGLRTAAMYETTNLDGETLRVLYARSADDRIYKAEQRSYMSAWTSFIELPHLSAIPIVPARTLGGKGLYEGHLTTIDRIDYLIFSRLVIVDKQSFRKLWIKGLPSHMYAQDGTMVPVNWGELLAQKGPFGADILPGEEADVKETGATDFSALTSAIFSEIKNLAALTSTPLYVLDPSSVQQSALGADLADKVHRAKVRTLRVGLGECFSELMRLSFEVTGVPAPELEVVWAPLEDESWGSRAQTAAILKSVLPLRVIWHDVLQLNPDQIRMAEAELEALLYDTGGSALTPVPDGGLGEAMLRSGLTSAEAIPSLVEPGRDDGNSWETDFQDRMSPPTDDAARGPQSAANFILDYMQNGKAEVPAQEVIVAGRKAGFTESAIKTARSRISHMVGSRRSRNSAGRIVNIWFLIKRR